MATSEQRSDFVSKTRQAATSLLADINDLHALRRDMDYLALAQALTDGDCGGLTAAQVVAVYTTLDALEALLAQGHGTNLAAVRIG